MKRLLLLACLLALQLAVSAQEASSASSQQAPPETKAASKAQPAQESQDEEEETTAKPAAPQRLFFPKNWYWGFAQFDIAPPHNEVDPNLCAANAGNFGGINAQCNAFARYMIWGNAEFRPIGRTFAKGLMIFFDPNLTFGKNVPQYLYTWSWKPIGMEYSYGVGFDFPHRIEFRFTAHPLMARFGSRDRPLGPAWLGPNGPWGRYNSFGVRKYFGHRPQVE